MDFAKKHRRQRKNYLPWIESPDEVAAEQEEWQAFLTDQYDLMIGEGVFLSPDAVIVIPDGQIGDQSWVAGGAVVRGDIDIGAHCSVNSYATLAGEVTMGDGIRIAPTASIWGFNHGFEDPDKPIYEQESTSDGVTISDDVWIGAGALILDGVTVGPHSIVGAGAVVTEDVSEYSIVAGNPATLVRSRLNDRAGCNQNQELVEQLGQFNDRVTEHLETVLNRYRQTDDRGEYFADKPGDGRTVRAWCDAVEIAAMFDAVPPGWKQNELIDRLQEFQDPETGLIPEPGKSTPEEDPTLLPRSWDRYNILAAGYALEVLDATFEHEIRAVEKLPPERLYDHLDQLRWEDQAWFAGNWVDCYATGLYFNQRHFDGQRSPASIFGWLETNVDPSSGLWGEPTAKDRWMHPVNGFYLITRGTYAQFGLDVPYPEVAIDTVLRHSRDPNFFREEQLNACNVLDVIHPLWFCGQQTDYRRDDAQAWAQTQISRIIKHWQDERGFAFDLAGGTPSLQGTEMWLSILYLLADICNMSDTLTYEPKGVHRTSVPLQLRE